MPYIKEEIRPDFVPELRVLLDKLLANNSSGNQNFCFSYLLDELASVNLCYDNLNNLVGMLESVKAEFQRRVVAPYEDLKIKENGDVYKMSSYALTLVDKAKIGKILAKPITK